MYTNVITSINACDPRVSKYLTAGNWPVTNQDPGHTAEPPLCGQVLTLLFSNPGDVRVVPREGLMMGKGGTQAVLGRSYLLTYMNIFQYVINQYSSAHDYWQNVNHS